MWGHRNHLNIHMKDLVLNADINHKVLLNVREYEEAQLRLTTECAGLTLNISRYAKSSSVRVYVYDALHNYEGFMRKERKVLKILYLNNPTNNNN